MAPSGNPRDAHLQENSVINQNKSDQYDNQPEEAEKPVVIKQLNGTDQDIIIVGVENLDRRSGREAEQLIESGWPDIVCLDLDTTRAKILEDQDHWESLTINTVIKEKLLTALMLNLLVSSYQRKFENPSNAMPGDEIFASMKLAVEWCIPVLLVDRDLYITYGRASQSIGYLAKFKLLLMALKRLVKYEKVSMEEVRELPAADAMSAFLLEMTTLAPDLKQPLVDERDEYTSLKITSAQGRKVLAIVGAGRVDGIRRNLLEKPQVDPAELEGLKEPSLIGKWSKIVVPIALIIGLFYLGFSQGKEFLRENLAFWIAANSLLTGLGAILAGAHILAIITAVIVAPFSPLIPAGPGTVAAIVQFIVRPPLVTDFQSFTDDITHPLQWRKNRILKIILIMVLCGLGSILGTLLGTSKILFSLFSLE